MVRAILRPRTFVLVGTLAVLVVFPYLYRLPFFSSFLSDFRTFQGTRFAIWLIILMGLNLLTGYSGQISLGHAAFVAVGAYIAAILMKDSGMPVFAAILLAALLTGLLGFLMGVPAGQQSWISSHENAGLAAQAKGKGYACLPPLNSGGIRYG